MNPTVPPSTSVRRSRAGNIDTDRLVARQEFLSAMADGNFRNCGSRREFVDRAREMRAIEDVLSSRGVQFRRRTLTASQVASMTCV